MDDLLRDLASHLWHAFHRLRTPALDKMGKNDFEKSEIKFFCEILKPLKGIIDNV
jgi:hypothetical protein